MKSFYGAVFVFLFAVAVVAGIADDKILIKEIYASPPPEVNDDFNVLKDGVFSRELKRNVQWNIDAKTSLAHIQLDIVLESSSIVKKIELHAMQRLSWGIFMPSSVSFQGSSDGRKWKDFGTVSWESKEDRIEHSYILDVPSEFSNEINFVRLYINMGLARKNFSAVCVDEVSIYGLKAESSPTGKPAKLVRNCIANGSFESNSIPAVPDFWSATCYWPHYDYVNMVNIFSDTFEPFSGNYSLCFDGSAFSENFKANDMKIGQSFLIGSSSKYTVSFYSKAKVPGASLKVISGKASKEFKLSDNWERYEFVTTYTQNKKQFLFFQLVPVENLAPGAGIYQGSQKIWVDDVQIEEGESAGPYTTNYLDMASVKQQEAETARPVVKVSEIKEIINPDAIFDEPFYKKVPDINQLHYLGSSEIAKAGISAYIFRDKKNLHISVNAPVLDGSMPSASVLEHDGAVYTDDSIEIFLMPDSRKNEYFHLAINSAGTVFDERYQFGDKAVADTGWTAPFKYAVNKQKGHWNLDIQIPLVWFERHLGDGDFKFNICRKNASWAAVQSGFHEPGNFGIVTGLDSLKRKYSIRFGSVSSVYDLKAQNNILELPVYNETDKLLDLTVKAIISSAEFPGRKVAKEQQVIVEPNSETVLKIVMDENLRDLHYIDVAAFGTDGKLTGQTYQDIILKAPVMLRLNKFIIKGESIAISPLFSFKAKSSFAAVLQLKDIEGKVLFFRNIPVLSEKTEIFPSKDLPDGWYFAELSIADKDGSLISSCTKKTYVSSPVPSWSRIDSETKLLVVNGKAIFPFGVYFQPLDGLSSLSASFFNICLYRPSLPFDGKRCLKFLDEAGKNGISVFIDLTTIMRMEKDETEFFKILEGIVNLVRKHPAYSGIHQCDEPNNKPEGFKTQESLRKIYAFLETIDPAHMSFFVVGGVLTYRYAFDAEDVICYDRYATVTGTETRNLRENVSPLTAALSAASYYDKPAWRCLEGNEGAFPNWVRNPSAKEWDVLVFSTLAAGGNGIFLWSGEPSFLKLRDVWHKTNEKFSEIVPYFLKGRKSSSVKLVAPENLLWRAVDFEGQTILLIVNLDYQKVSCRFNIGRKISSVYDLMKNKAIIYNGDPELSYELAPYEVIALSIK